MKPNLTNSDTDKSPIKASKPSEDDSDLMSNVIGDLHSNISNQL